MQNGVYIHPKSPSLKARFVKLALNITISKTEIQQRFEKNAFGYQATPITEKTLERLNVVVTQVAGRDVYTLSPKGGKIETIVLYLHGGGYINNVRKQHWNFIEKLIEQTNAEVVLPDYFLAPKDTYKASFDMVEKIYADLRKTNPNKKIIIMGDSAGGGFALSLAEKLKVDKKVQPSQIILISPWLDVTNSNPDIECIQPKDPFLKDTEGFRMAGKAYAGNTDPKNYMLSPIYGDWSDLAPISLFIGTHETLFADATKFKKLSEERNISINFYQYPKMFHDFPMVVTLPEAKMVLKQITALICN